MQGSKRYSGLDLHWHYIVSNCFHFLCAQNWHLCSDNPHETDTSSSSVVNYDLERGSILDFRVD